MIFHFNIKARTLFREQKIEGILKRLKETP
jgi:hypothetical protein